MDKALKKKFISRLLKEEYNENIKNLINNELESIKTILNQSKNYDDIIECIELLKEISVRETEKSLNIIDNLLSNLNNIELSYESSKYYTKEDLARIYDKNSIYIKILDILSYIRYLDIEKVVNILLKHSINQDEDIYKKIIKILEDASEYNIKVLKDRGFETQTLIINLINKLLDQEKLKYADAISIICKKLLSTTASSNSYQFNSFTFGSGYITPSDEYKTIRESSISILKNLYKIISDSDLVNKSDKKIDIIQSLNQACYLDYIHSNEVKDETYYKLLEISIKDAGAIIEFYKKHIKNEECKILSAINDKIAIIYTRLYKDLNDDKIEFKKLIKEIEDIRGDLFKNDDFVIYKNLTWGWQSSSYCEKYYTDCGNLNIVNIEDSRSKIIEYSKLVTYSNLSEWIERISGIIKDEYKNLPPSIANFFYEVTKNNSQIGQKILNEKLAEISKYLNINSSNTLVISILSSLIKHNNEKGKDQIKQYIEKNIYIKECILSLSSDEEIDISLMNNLLNKIIDNSEFKPEILLYFIDSIEDFLRPLDKKKRNPINDKLKIFLLDIIKKINNYQIQIVKEFRYCFIMSYLSESCNEDECKLILDNILFNKYICYGSEEVLIAIGDKYPHLIINHFDKRIEIDKKSSTGQYDAIPDNIQHIELKNILKNNIDLIITSAKKNFDNDKSLFPYKGGKIFKAIFSELTPEFKKKLINIIKNNNNDDFYFIIAILRSYTILNDEVSFKYIPDICKEIIKSPLYDESKELYSEICIILCDVGVVWGKYGISEFLQKKLDIINNWQNDQDEKIVRFYNQFKESIEKDIKEDIKISNEIEERREFEFNEKIPNS